jgi:hypothetical protein
VKRAIFDMPKENAPGSDGFIAAFYCTCWATVHSNVTQAVRQLAQLRGKNFNHLNTANIVLLPKKSRRNALEWPIRIVHSVAKIFLKILVPGLPHALLR